MQQNESAISKPIPSTKRIFQAVRELRAMDQIATRETVAELTGLKLSVVDDRLRTLVDDGRLKRLLRSAYEVSLAMWAEQEMPSLMRPIRFWLANTGGKILPIIAA